MTSKLGTALVTGASSGIGATYADRLASRGYDLILVARDAERLGQLAEKLKTTYGVGTDVLRADLSERADVLKVEDRLRQDEAITLFVNNAGIGPVTSLLESDVDYLDTMVALNVTAANRLAVAAAQTFAKRRAGAIINTASVVALAPQMFNGTYSATKAFVLSLTESLAAELNGKNVRIQAVLPGLTRTEIFDRVGRSFDDLDQEKVMDVADLVDAALAGFDQGELVTIPALADDGIWNAYLAARGALGPHLSLRKPAARYGVGS
ncbi:SDR family NAD(P)-dependent oxidoreductase [Aliirhizobium smilacinae]|uniref:SDR family oxidoreductase n=1 Tax=Aliirhizobium smilacinae TaxID=1395944 RepID=A0A5C4XPB2_9HYPH|nr:SDR family oxidoreductase [Rhizobium smilacinae]TNM65396.1 SDR family oxidoreductase [Rhizobium smilacinae]